MLLTKLHIPRAGDNLVHRPYLFEKLNKGLNCRLILISATAGYGKTTLLSSWINQINIPTTWYSLDKRDNDPGKFLSFLIYGIHNTNREIGKDCLMILDSNQKVNAQHVAELLINDILKIENDILCVLDDFHLIESNEVVQIVDFLIKNSPEKFHIAISTRSDPSLPLARMRSQNDLVEVRSSDLNFSSNEINIFFNKKLKLELTDEEISLLEKKTEGWIAGLQLTALSMQGRKDVPDFIRALAGNNRYIMDYLLEEILNIQDSEMEEFLLSTSILEKLSAPLCNALLNKQDSQDKLQYLEKNNMFIVSLDDERIWYRYHHLFAEILQKRLKNLKADIIPELHKRACKWYEQNNQKEEAVEHALLAKDFEYASHLIGEFAHRVLDYGFDTQTLRWYKSLPDEFIYKDPNLTFACGGMLFQRGNYDEAEKHFLIAEKLVEKRLDAESKEIMGRISVMRAFILMYLEDVKNVMSYASKALEFLPDTSYVWRASAIINIGYTHLFLGNYTAAIQK